MFRVELRHWREGSGYTHGETFDNIEGFCTAEEYLNSLDTPLTVGEGEGVNVEIYSDDDTMVSEFWLSKEV